jgi:hypothetical protein
MSVSPGGPESSGRLAAHSAVNRPLDANNVASAVELDRFAYVDDRPCAANGSPTPTSTLFDDPAI